MGIALSSEKSNKSVQISFATFPLALPGYTSNHNTAYLRQKELISVSIGSYTSNHNYFAATMFRSESVSIGGYTSNHNSV